jgi:endonuclease G
MNMKLAMMLTFTISFALNATTHTCHDKLLIHNFHKTCFNTSKKLARWVSYKLSEPMFRGDARRLNNFAIDPLIPNQSPTPSHYQNSGYDRGHLAPAGDMKINQNAMDQSFYMTNITAQEPSFNRGIWKKLENLMRGLTEADKEYEVITGPIFNFKKKSFKTRFLNIPKAFYKIIYFNNGAEIKTLAFLIPNKKSNEAVSQFLVPINTIEALTNINFFSNLTKETQDEIESKVTPELWGL